MFITFTIINKQQINPSMKKQLILFFIILVTVITLAQVLFLHNGFNWSVIIFSGLAGVLSTFFFWLIIRKKKG